MSNFSFSTYISAFAWRYASPEMRYIFSELHKYELWRRIWVALAEVQQKIGLVSQKELEDLQKNEKKIDIDRILEIEKETKHDVVAAIREFAEKARVAGRKIHLGATSMDIVDNADILRVREGLLLVERRLNLILTVFGKLITKYANFPCIGYTHLQPAEPTTVGYRLAFYAQDLLDDLIQIRLTLKNLKGKGFKGAVGTSASYKMLLRAKGITAERFDREVMKELGLEPMLITSQIYPRRFDFLVLSTLASIASSLAKFAGDLRILQSPSFGEWSEPYSEKQVGSSAMPFKRNPVGSENICSLARYVTLLPNIALENASLSYLERTLDDSANRRIILAEGFLATDQILMTAEKIITGLIINERRIIYNLNLYAPFAATEAILMEAVKRGADRQKMHELLRRISLAAWKAIQAAKPNPMKDLIVGDKRISKFLSEVEIDSLFDVKNYIGDAPERALKFVKKIEEIG